MFPKFSLEIDPSIEIESIIDDLEKLTDFQLKAFSLLRALKRFVVTGGAGTGKTILAVNRAKELANAQLNTLLIVSSLELAATLRGGAPHFKPESRLKIFAIDEFLNMIWTEIYKSSFEHIYPFINFEIDDVQFHQELADLEKWSLEKYEEKKLEALICLEGNDAWKFDALLVDEAQSISKECMEYLKFFLRNDGFLYIFGDSYQEVKYPQTFRHGHWGHNGESALESVLKSDLPKFELDVNCRCSEEIAKFAHKFTPAALSAIGVKGISPKAISGTVSTWKPQIVDQINEWVSQQKVNPTKIGVFLEEADAGPGWDEEFGFTGIQETESVVIDWLGTANSSPIIGNSPARAHLWLKFHKNFFAGKLRKIGCDINPLFLKRDDLTFSFDVLNWFKSAGIDKGSFAKEVNEDCKNFYKAKSQELSRTGLPVITPLRSPEWDGLEYDAVLVFIPIGDHTRTSSFHYSNIPPLFYKAFSRARVLLSIIGSEKTLEYLNLDHSMFNPEIHRHGPSMRFESDARADRSEMENFKRLVFGQRL